MDWAALFGVLAGIFSSIRFIPQVYRSYKTKHTKDLSLAFLCIVTAQSVFLILYGVARPDNYVLLMNVFPLVCAAFLIWLKLRYK
jgi:MtN3 and saliva related transmembrane protein